METYSEYIASESSEKIGLVRLEASQRLVGWSVYSGSVYSMSFDKAVVVSIEDSGATLTAATSIAGVTAGKYYNDRDTMTLYLRTSDSVNPNGKFIGLTFRMFFSNAPVAAPHDLASGFDVEWIPSLLSTSEFGVELDNQNQLGVAIEGSGNIKLANDHEYWGSRFDKLYFENQTAEIYSWNRHLPIAQAKLLYRGKIQSKDWDINTVTFKLKDALNELRSPVPVASISELSGIRVSDALLNAKQRRVYGYVFGHVPTPLDQELDTYPLTGTVSIIPAGTTLTGVGTSFLTHLSPDDELLLDGDTDYVTIKSIESDTSATVSDEYTGNQKDDVTYEIKPDKAKRYINREFLIAGHSLREPNATVTSSDSFFYADVDTTDGLRAGDVVTVGSELTAIRRFSGNRIFFTTALLVVPPAGTNIYRPSVDDVRINKDLLTLTRDYTYDATAGTMTLDPLAEFNIAQTRPVAIGKMIFQTGSRIVYGVETSFKNEIPTGAWVRAQGEVDFFEVLQVVSDTELLLRTESTYSTVTSFLTPTGNVGIGTDVISSLSSLQGIKVGMLVTGTGVATGSRVASITDTGSTRAVKTTVNGTSNTSGSTVTFNTGVNGFKKEPLIYGEKDVNLSCSVLGATDDGTPDGNLLETAPLIVKDLLILAGLESQIDAASFEDTNDLAKHRVAFVIPETYNGTKAPSVRDVINQLNQSVFGSLVQNADFELQYRLLDPSRDASVETLSESDIIKFAVKSSSDKLVKDTVIQYLVREYDYGSDAPSFLESRHTSDSAQYLADTSKEFVLKTRLVDEASARMMAARWGLIFEVSSSVLKVETTLKMSSATVGDKVLITHEKLYERVGSTIKSKVAGIQSSRKTVSDSSVELEDLANAFSRCSIITENDHAAFDESTDSEKIFGGYITDTYGMIDNDPDTFGNHLIW